jgi:hypothetical protein
LPIVPIYQNLLLIIWHFQIKLESAAVAQRIVVPILAIQSVRLHRPHTWGISNPCSRQRATSRLRHCAEAKSNPAANSAVSHWFYRSVGNGLVKQLSTGLANVWDPFNQSNQRSNAVPQFHPTRRTPFVYIYLRAPSHLSMQ